MFKAIFILCLYIFSVPVHASGFNPQGIWAFLFIFVYFVPYIIGVMLIGKGNRYWFSFFSFLIYALSFCISIFSPGLSEMDIFSFFIPYILIIIAFIKRKRNGIS